MAIRRNFTARGRLPFIAGHKLFGAGHGQQNNSYFKKPIAERI
jgi:hypothetical protein